MLENLRKNKASMKYKGD